MAEPSSEDMNTAEPDRVAEELRELPHVLSRLEGTVAAGRRLAAEALDRLADPEGLLEFVDAECLSESGFGLRAWLADLQAAARAGRTDDVASGIRRWQKLAGDAERAADRVEAANGTPMRYLSELRGRLSGHQAKAVSLALTEDGELSALHSRARAVLRGTPVDLRLAEQYVHAYEEAVNRRAEGTPDSEKETVRRAGGGRGERRKQNE